MSIPPSRSYRNGKRGRHKHVTSPETKLWAEIAAGTAWLAPAEDMAPSEAPAAPPPPERPGWLDEADYEALLELRGRLA